MKSEAKIQSEVFQTVWNEYPELRRLFFHIPNGGKRHIVEATKFKSMGVVAGIPDMFLALARGRYHGFFIELKNEVGKIDKKQLAIHDKLRAQGYRVDVHDNFEDCYFEIEKYIRADDNISPLTFEVNQCTCNKSEKDLLHKPDCFIVYKSLID